jgi:DNA-binding beta-propeller fold protein YncE
VFERCGTPDDGCAKIKTVDPVIKFGPDGKVAKSWGKGDIIYPHGIFVGRDRHVWTVEGISQSNVVADVIHEYDQNGKLLRTMGVPGTTGDSTDRFNGVSDVLVAPDGSIFVADGHSNKTNNRILKYDHDGKFLLSWGKLGEGPGEFNAPHGLAMDKAGRLYVADRSNNRIQIFDQQGKFLGEWKQFGRPSGIFITKDDMIYVADSLSNKQNNPGFGNGIRWGKVSDGKVLGFIPWGEYNAIEGVAVDRDGNIYAGFTNVPNFRRFVKN